MHVLHCRLPEGVQPTSSISGCGEVSRQSGVALPCQIHEPTIAPKLKEAHRDDREALLQLWIPLVPSRVPSVYGTE